MSVLITVEKFTGSFPRDHESMFSIIKTIILNDPKPFNECKKVVITFNDLTKANRYTLHLLTIKGIFEAVSHTFNGNRILNLHLDKQYIEDVFKNHIFESKPLEILTEQQINFNYLIKIIEKDFTKEFKIFLESI